MESSPKVPSARVTRSILWLSFLIAIAAYGIVGYLVFTPGTMAKRLPDWLWPILALFAAISAFVVPSRIEDLAPDSDAGLRVPEIVGWALAETVAILGLVSVALGAHRGPLIFYLAAAAILLWLRRPQD